MIIKMHWFISPNSNPFPRHIPRVNKAVSSVSGDKIVIFSETNNVPKDIYLFECKKPITRINPLKPLILKSSFPQDSSQLKLASSSVEFSPNEDECFNY